MAAFVIPAEGQTPPASSALPSDADLDALLAARNWKALGTIMSRPHDATSSAQALSWLRAKIDQGGGGFFLGIVYARELWIFGSSLNTNDPAKDVRLTAGMIALYTYQLIVIDGARCEDRTAPSAHASQLFQKLTSTFAYMRMQSADWKSKMVDISIALEKKTSALRADDELVCRGGTEEMKAALEKGTRQEVQDPSHFGKTVTVTAPPDFVPKLVSPEIYKPMQEKARADMHESLLKLLQ